MSVPQRQPDSSKLDAFLDGQLPSAERDAMARDIAASRELQSEVELQSQIDDSLQRSFALPAIPSELVAKLRTAAAPRVVRASKPRNWKLLAVAAVAASLVWGMLAWQFLGKDPDAPDYNPRKPLDSIYATTVAEGFKPTWICKDDAEFISTFKQRHGQGLLLATADMPAGTKMEGLTYVGGMSRYTTTMLARVDDQPVMVFVDRADCDFRPASPCGSCGLHLFSKQLGPLMLYELTPLAEPRVMEYLHLAK